MSNNENGAGSAMVGADSIGFDNGALVAKDFAGQWRLCKLWVASGMLPQQYNSAEKVMIGLQYARELGLKGLMALRQIAVIKGTPSIYGDLPLAIVRHSGQLAYFKEWFVDDHGEQICSMNKNLANSVFGAVCHVKRKGDEEVSESFFTVEEAKSAGLFSNDTYKKWLKTMLKRRARAMNLKDQFADLLEGMAIAEYDHNIMPDSPEGARHITINDRRDAIDMPVKQNPDDMKNDFMETSAEVVNDDPEDPPPDPEPSGGAKPEPETQQQQPEKQGPTTTNGTSKAHPSRPPPSSDPKQKERDDLAYLYATANSDGSQPSFDGYFIEAMKMHLRSLRTKCEKIQERRAAAPSMAEDDMIREYAKAATAKHGGNYEAHKARAETMSLAALQKAMDDMVASEEPETDPDTGEVLPDDFGKADDDANADPNQGGFDLG